MRRRRHHLYARAAGLDDSDALYLLCRSLLRRLAGDTVRDATTDEVKDLRDENRQLKEVVAEMTLQNRVLNKSLTAAGDAEDDS